VERKESGLMSGSGERFQTEIPPMQSHLGSALRLQVISPLLIFFGLLTLSDVISVFGDICIIAAGVLYAIAFLKLVILRALLQKERYSIHAAAILALLASLLLLIISDQLIFVVSLDWLLIPVFLLSANVVVNIVLFYHFFCIHQDGGIKSAFLAKNQDSPP
jgi:hypothetical protein